MGTNTNKKKSSDPKTMLADNRNYCPYLNADEIQILTFKHLRTAITYGAKPQHHYPTQNLKLVYVRQSYCTYKLKKKNVILFTILSSNHPFLVEVF